MWEKEAAFNTLLASLPKEWRYCIYTSIEDIRSISIPLAFDPWRDVPRLEPQKKQHFRIIYPNGEYCDFDGKVAPGQSDIHTGEPPVGIEDIEITECGNIYACCESD